MTDKKTPLIVPADWPRDSGCYIASLKEPNPLVGGYRLDDLERLYQRSSQGEWKLGTEFSWGGRSLKVLVDPKYSEDDPWDLVDGCFETCDDAAFVVAVHQVMPWLIGEIRRLRAQLASMF